MPELLSAFVFCALLSASAVFGVLLRGWLPEEHLTERNMEALRLVTSLLVTFAALVLSLQLSSGKAAFDTAYRDRNADAGQLARLDQCLREYGEGAERAREKLRSYTAAVIASTWPEEEKPAGVSYPDMTGMARQGESATLSALIREIGREINGLDPQDSMRRNLAADCRAVFSDFQQHRWAVIEDAHGSLTRLFLNIVIFWLMLVFVSFGLQVPRKLLAAVVLAIGVISISSVMFVIFDLEWPYGGVFGIPSDSMRSALATMSR
jgi:hypothetical protein